MRTYRHYRPREIWFPMVLVGVIGVASPVALVLAVVGAFGPTGPPAIVFTMPLVVVGFNAWWFGFTAREACLGDDGHVEFVSIMKRVRIPVMDIVSIQPSKMRQVPMFVVKHRGGTLRFDPRLNGMHELIAELKRVNPGIALTGI